MCLRTEYPTRILVTVLLCGVALVSLLVAFAPATSIEPIGPGDAFLLAWIALHLAWSLTVLLGSRTEPLSWSAIRPVAEGLFFFGGFLFLFAYIFALNANMDYVQRFIESGGNLQLALDTRTERLIATARFAPLLVLDLGLWIFSARRSRSDHAAGPGSAGYTGGGVISAWSPVLTIVAVILSVLAQPSAARLDGIPLLGWFSLVPLFLVLRSHVEAGRFGQAIWYGLLYGVLFTLVGNFWLGTFNLISLQAVGVIFFFFYGAFMPLAVGALELIRSPRLRPLVLPLAWTAFELARSSGFLGYPWLLVAHSQYRVLSLIQIAEIGGVWMVSFVVLLVNSLLAEAILAVGSGSDCCEADDRADDGANEEAARGTAGEASDELVHGVTNHGRLLTRFLPARGPMIAVVAVLAVSVLTGTVLRSIPVPSRGRVRLALIQQNSDPRKHEYARTLDSLSRLTDKALAYEPDLVVWSETAFVPNLRRWSEEDPRRYSLARLVREFIAYQQTLDTWLVTGNDDYRRVLDDEGQEVERHNFNAAVMFDPAGERRETYHKIKLVPFTEYFPFEEQFPWVYQMLLEFDVAFWTPGEERTVFEHPSFRFSTPICFEDVFPREVRGFALAGMEVIVNLTNDYWSLQEVAAQQHFVAALFRTVELRRPMVRSTASGVTSHIDAYGRIIATVPQYSEQYLVVDVDVPDGSRTTLYERWGDWFPLLAAFVLIVMGGASGVQRLRRETWRGGTSKE
jgi:apolipoprotein N-acyltransferase